jgi:hypothetical protein
LGDSDLPAVSGHPAAPGLTMEPAAPAASAAPAAPGAPAAPAAPAALGLAAAPTMSINKARPVVSAQGPASNNPPTLDMVMDMVFQQNAGVNRQVCFYFLNLIIYISGFNVCLIYWIRKERRLR